MIVITEAEGSLKRSARKGRCRYSDLKLPSGAFIRLLLEQDAARLRLARPEDKRNCMKN
ncbi:hypothetical protein M8494_11135 [Serratia ureilytica]